MSDDGNHRRSDSREVKGPQRGEGPCGFPAGDLWDGDGDRWWRVEMRGHGVRLIHQQRDIPPIALTSDLVEGGHVQAYVRRLGVPDVEARAFDAWCRLFKSPGWSGGKRTNNEHDRRPPKHPPKELRRIAAEVGSQQLLERIA